MTPPAALAPAAPMAPLPPAPVAAPAPPAVVLVPVAPPAPMAAPAAPAMSDAEQRLVNIKRLYDKGLLTKAEYEKKRQEIIKGL
jgi:hypothetical protein